MDLRAEYMTPDRWHSTPVKRMPGRRDDSGSHGDIINCDRRNPSVVGNRSTYRRLHFGHHGAVTVQKDQEQGSAFFMSPTRRGPSFSKLRMKGSPKFRNDPSPCGGAVPRNRRGHEGVRAKGFHSPHSVPLRYKTELCRASDEGTPCKFGSGCTFAHGFGELRPISRHPKYKTDLCRTYHNSGVCQYGARCHFVHSLEEVTGVSRVNRYINWRCQNELARMLSTAADQKNNVNQTTSDDFLNNLSHLLSLQSLHNPEEAMPANIARQSSAGNPRSAITKALTAASVIQKLNSMTLNAPPSMRDTEFTKGDKYGEHLSSSFDHPFQLSQERNVDTNMQKCLDASAWSSSSFAESPPKDSDWDNHSSAKQSFSKYDSLHAMKDLCPSLSGNEQYHDTEDVSLSGTSLLSFSMDDSI